MIRDTVAGTERVVVWAAQPGPQTALLACPIFEVFFGGARGGGKTDGMLGDFAVHAQKYGPHAKGIFFRRRERQLENVIARATELYTKLGARYVGAPKNHFIFPNGAILKMRHLWDAKAADDYLGHDYSRIYAEEMTQWPTPDALFKVMGTLRSAAGVPVGFRGSANPGGPGHLWVKARYVTPARLGYKVLRDPRTGLERVFIPSRLQDNRILCENDPNYANRLKQTGPPHLVKAWLAGDWDIVAGGFFEDKWNPSRHIVPNFSRFPDGWRWRRAFDWGYSSPASLGLYAITDGNHTDEMLKAGMHFPRGSIIRVDEWYTVSRNDFGEISPNVGLRLTNTDLGAGIAKRSAGRRYVGCVADPSIFTDQGGPSIYKQMQKGAKESEFRHALLFAKADNNRVAGWQNCRDYLEEAMRERPEKPGFWVADKCEHFLRTVPTLESDEKNADDINTDAEDHAADDWRYLIQSVAKGGAQRVKVTGA